MKKSLKVLSLVLALAITALCMAGCGSKSSTDGKKLKIGIIQYMSHPSLDNCYKGVTEGLKSLKQDYEIDYQVGSAASADSDCTNFASNMVSGNCDMIIAIATPAAKAAYTATADTDIPVVFCAVSDPVEAKLVSSLETPGDNCSGTSDVLDLSAQVKMIKSIQPEVKKIGILYTSSEDNSVSNLKRFREVCKTENIEVVASAIQSASDVPSAAEDLAGKVDCINNFTDNNVVNNLSVVLSAAEKHNIPVYGSEEEQVKNGCLASVSIDYVALGKVTGEMAVDALNGSDLSKMSVKQITDATPIVNEKVLNSLSLKLPKDFENATIIK